MWRCKVMITHDALSGITDTTKCLFYNTIWLKRTKISNIQCSSRRWEYACAVYEVNTSFTIDFSRSRKSLVKTEKKQNGSLTSHTNAGETTHLNYPTNNIVSKDLQTSVCFPGCSYCHDVWSHRLSWTKSTLAKEKAIRPCQPLDTLASSFVSFGPTTPSLVLCPSATDNEHLGYMTQ